MKLATLDIDRTFVHHEGFNKAPMARLLADHAGKVALGLGRVVALYYRLSTLYHIR